MYSEPGHGTTSSFIAHTGHDPLPVERTVTRNPDNFPGLPGQTVLVVEDESTIRSKVRECLQKLGYRVLEADNGAQQLCRSAKSTRKKWIWCLLT